MTRPAPLPRIPISPSSLTYVTPFSRASRSLRVGRLDVAHLGHVGMAEERVVVDGELRVERLHLALGRDDQRVDLAEHRVEVDERPVELLDDRHHLLLLGRVVDPGREDEPARLPRLEALERVDVQAREGVRALLRDLLDVHAALRREHEERLLLAPVEGDREVVLPRDVRRPLDPEPADDVAADVHAEDRCGVGLGLVGRVGELDPAGLAAAADEHLRLDDDLPAELLRGRPGLLRRRRQTPLGDGDPRAREELLPLVLVEIHGRARVYAKLGRQSLVRTMRTGRYGRCCLGTPRETRPDSPQGRCDPGRHRRHPRRRGGAREHAVRSPAPGRGRVRGQIEAGSVHAPPPRSGRRPSAATSSAHRALRGAKRGPPDARAPRGGGRHGGRAARVADDPGRLLARTSRSCRRRGATRRPARPAELDRACSTSPTAPSRRGARATARVRGEDPGRRAARRALRPAVLRLDAPACATR